MLKIAMPLATLAMGLTLLAAACGGDEPQALQIPLSLEHQELSPETIEVKQGDTVTLQIGSDEAGELHLHGYDLTQDVTPGEVVDLVFEASATGRFRITFHPTSTDEHNGHEDEHETRRLQEMEVGILEVHSQVGGDS